MSLLWQFACWLIVTVELQLELPLYWLFKFISFLFLLLFLYSTNESLVVCSLSDPYLSNLIFYYLAGIVVYTLLTYCLLLTSYKQVGMFLTVL